MQLTVLAATESCGFPGWGCSLAVVCLSNVRKVLGSGKMGARYLWFSDDSLRK